MSNEKIKTEVYSNFGGINTKASPHLTGLTEFLDLINYDFQTPGSLSQRWGSTMYVGQTLPGTISCLTEFGRLNGASYVVFGATGALYVGATTGNSQGMSFLNEAFFGISGNKSPRSGFCLSDIIWNGAGNAAGAGSANQLTPYNGNYGLRFQIGTSVSFLGQTIGANVLSFAVMANYLFGCDGNKFFRTDGVSTSFVGCPPPLVVNSGSDGVTVTNLSGGTLMGVGATGSYLFYGSYVNSRGFEGQIWPIICVNASQANAASLGGSFVQGNVLLNLPQQYDITSVNIYSFWSAATLTLGSTTAWNQPYTFLTNYTFTSPGISLTQATGGTAIVIPIGTTLGGQSLLIANLGKFPDTNTNTYFPLGFTLTNTSANGNGFVNTINIVNYIPSYMESHKNILFLAGFSATPSTVIFSDVGEPEGYPLANNFEVRTDDGDVITGIKAYANRLWIFKNRSYHALYGDSSLNFFLQEVSTSYGAINNRCILTYETEQGQYLSFLDRKGVIEQNGSFQRTLSNKIQPIFDTMNYAAAITTACMVHDKLRNQILCAIPVNGASLNNLTLVYDYLVGAWTKQDGFAPSVFAAIQGRNNTKNVFYGNYSGMINWFGASFLSDNGTGFTAYLKSRFHHDIGESYQKMYRRLYLDTSIPGTTFSFNLNFYQDYGSSIVGASIVNTTKFQTRIDFGISAKAIAFELSTLQSLSVLKLHGYTIESRLQRRV